MKTCKTVIIAIIALITFQSANAQSDKSQRTPGIKTQTLKVYGVCEMCKKRIETAVYTVDGIKSAVWDENTKQLTIKYSVFKKEAVENVQKKLAAVGHDTDKAKATDMAYKNLPECCHYERNLS